MKITDIDTSGFYHPEHLLRAGKFVYGPDFTLLRDQRDTYTYPVNGWTWFGSATAAAAAYGVNWRDFNLDLEPGVQESLED